MIDEQPIGVKSLEIVELKRVKHRSRIQNKQVQGGMGRAGRIAPRTCSTLELRTHLSSSSSSMLLTLPTSTMKPSSSPPSPSTPVQAAPASTTPSLQQEWPQDALQVVQLQLESLRSHASFANEPVTRKRGFEASSAVIGKVDQQADVSAGFEVELHAQPALPEDWEQFLDLKTGQLYYFHWSTCKRAKQDPRELIRRADECVQAHLLLAHARSPDCIEHSYVQDAKLDTSSSDQSAEFSSPALTSSECTGTGRCQKGECESEDQVCSSGEQRKLEGSGCRVDDSSEAVMVALGCHSCAMFVMLSLSAPACPSCGAHLHPDHDGVR